VLVGPVFILSSSCEAGLDLLGLAEGTHSIQLLPCVCHAFVLVFGQIWLNFFNQNGYAGTVQQIAGVFVQFVILSTVFIFGVLQVRSLFQMFSPAVRGAHHARHRVWR